MTTTRRFKRISIRSIYSARYFAIPRTIVQCRGPSHRTIHATRFPCSTPSVRISRSCWPQLSGTAADTVENFPSLRAYDGISRCILAARRKNAAKKEKRKEQTRDKRPPSRRWERRIDAAPGECTWPFLSRE